MTDCRNVPTDKALHQRLLKRARKQFGSESIKGARWVSKNYRAKGGSYKQVCKPKKRKKRSKALGYPPQPCGLPYGKFRGGWTFQEAYEQIAWGTGRRVSTKQVRGAMRDLKQLEFERYTEECSTAPTPAKRASDCCRLCKSGKPCGKSCISPRRTCRRQDTCACSLDEVQTAFDFKPEPGAEDRFGYDISEFQDFEGVGRKRRKRRKQRRKRGTQ